VEENAFRTWFLPIIPIKLENKKLVLQLPSSFFYDWIEENYVDLLRKTLDQTIGHDAVLEYIL
jgi:chromosomal replication initiator protein